VESRHCEVFQEQEISGEVLLGMDQTSIFMKEFDLGLVGRRLRTWHRIKRYSKRSRLKSSCEDKYQIILLVTDHQKIMNEVIA
jgi:hypothetical protein